MATAILKCRVCGKEYEACRSAKHVNGVFRWKDVACSPEHGAIYLARIRASRVVKPETVAGDPVAEAYALLDEDYLSGEDDELSYEEFDSDDDSDVED